MKEVVIIGAGPAGLTAGYELARHRKEYKVTILEAENSIGGLAKTITHASNYLDIGGHRFFSRSKKITAWWRKILPLQSCPTYDYSKTGRKVFLAKKGPNPQMTDKVLLRRQRFSHILYNHKFFEYPIKLNFKTLFTLGIKNTIEFGLSYLSALKHKLPETSLENFYINRFGRKIYEAFFESYTEKVWGKHPSELSADWGAQRVKGLSLKEVVVNFFCKTLHLRHRTETSLIQEFFYPKFGPGQLWERVANIFTSSGGKLIRNAKVTELVTEGNRVTQVGYKKDGEKLYINADIVISSMPLKDLVYALGSAPENVAKVAKNLPFRDFVCIGVLVKRMKLRNKTKIKTLNNIIPDCWLYVQDKDVKLGRIQIYNNWSPFMVKDPKKYIWLGLEYFCSEGDEYWKRNKQQWREVAVKDLLNAGIIYTKKDVRTYCVKKVLKAYPAYYGAYENIAEVRDFVDNYENLYCVGRGGQHHYNNMDHSMMTSFAAVRHIMGKTDDKKAVWTVNCEPIYHEQKDS